MREIKPITVISRSEIMAGVPVHVEYAHVLLRESLLLVGQVARQQIITQILQPFILNLFDPKMRENINLN